MSDEAEVSEEQIEELKKLVEEMAAEPIEEPVKDEQLNTGWFCITRDFKIMKEWEGITEDNPTGGRPLDLANNNELVLVGTVGNGHTVAVDLIEGRFFIGFDRVAVQNGTIELNNTRLMFSICEETNIVGEYKHRKTTKPDKKGDYFITYDPMIFRPIWFTRHISTLPGPVYVIGAQTTTPRDLGKRNIKKIISLFPDGRIGIS